MLPIILDNRIRIKAEDLLKAPAGFTKELENRLTFQNPRYMRDLRYKPDSKPVRFFYGFYRVENWLLVNRGFMAGLIRLCHKYRMKYEIDDRCVKGENTPAVFTGTLHGYQVKALLGINKRFGLVIGPVNSGKKVLAAAWIGEQRASTLILVKSKMQLFRWEQELKKFLDCPEEVGVLGGGKAETGKKILVSTDRSAYRHVDIFRSRFGNLVIDRADTMNLRVFSGIVAELPTRNILALACSGKRPDRNTGYVRTYTGGEMTRLNAIENQGSGGKRKMKITLTGYEYAYADDWHDMISDLTADSDRNSRIIEDILAETAEPKTTAVVLSERTDHLVFLKKKMEQRDAEIVDGDTAPKAAEKIVGRYKRGNLQIIFCTFRSMEKLGKINRADYTFVTSPIRLSETLAQMTGRLLGADSVIYDYRDKVKVLEVSLKQREKYYRRMGCR